MINKAFMRNYSRGERVLLSGLFLVMACFLVWMAYGLLQSSWQVHLLDERFEREGAQAEGVVSGFRYVAHTGKYGRQNSGDYPVVAIETPQGAFHILSSYEYPLNKTMQAKLMGQKVAVVYLLSDPSTARVPQWQGSSFSVLTVLGVFVLLAGLFVGFISFKMLINGKSVH
jgi:hypothetical protein